MKKYLLALILSCFLNTLSQAKEIRIGIIIDGSSDRVIGIEKLFKKEIIDLTRIEFEVKFPEKKRIDGRWDLTTIQNGINTLLADPEIDLILALGVASSHLISTRGDLEKPTIAPFIIDATLQDLPIKKGHSDVKNLCFVNIPSSVYRDLDVFINLTSLKDLTVLINPLYLEAIPGFEQRFTDFARMKNISVKLVPVRSNIQAVLESLPKETGGVYVSGIVHLPNEKFSELIDGITARNLPSITFLGREDVERGILTSLRSDFFPRLSRRIALNAQRIFIGDKPHQIPVQFPLQEQMIINMQTARDIGFYLPWSFLDEAELLHDQVSEDIEDLSLEKAIADAVRNNLDLAARRLAVVSGQQEVNRARTVLYPQISANVTGLLIDKDRAEASFGSQAERSLTGSLSASQLIFSEQSWANLSIQNSLQRSRQSELEVLNLDLTLSAAAAYINVLRALALESIEKENLKISKKNYTQARIRESIGTANPSEVYRWESQIANNHNSLLRAESRTNQARVELNRILHKSLETEYQLEDLDSTSVLMQRARFLANRYISNPNLFKIFRDFMVVLTSENSHELRSMDAAIAAQKRALSSARNSFWAPTIALSGEYSSIFDKSGAGSSSINIPGLSFPTADDNTWSLALNLSFPLFKGAEKFVENVQAKEELNRLEIEHLALAERLEQRTRAILFRAAASYSAIEKANIAARAAVQSLNIVEDSYSGGSLNILDLLDAQNNALISNQLAEDALYAFISDLMSVQRASGYFYFIDDLETFNAFVERLNTFYADSGVEFSRVR